MSKAELEQLLRYAVNRGATDIHLSAGCQPILRVNGYLKRLEGSIITSEELQRSVESILTEKQKKTLATAWELDFAFSLPGVARFRVNLYFQLRGQAAAFRVIPERIPSLEEIQAPTGVYTLARKREGLVLVTGPTGAGKSTTLAAIIDLIDQERQAHIITIEDPIEYVYAGRNCLINQREIGRHSRAFAPSLRSALREDPDVILIGEMRDLETISLALTAAETGHLVLTTLHTNSAAETVDRIVDVFPAEQQNQVRSMFSNSVQGVISQRLLPMKDGRGRVAVMEVMIATPAIRNLIRERKAHQIPSTIQTSVQYGMQTLDQGLLDLLRKGKISTEVALAHAIDKRLFRK